VFSQDLVLRQVVVGVPQGHGDRHGASQLAGVLLLHALPAAVPAGIKVYKVGDEAEKAAFVVGKTTDGKWAGQKTTVVET
jgi:hypothetical protein